MHTVVRTSCLESEHRDGTGTKPALCKASINAMRKDFYLFE